MLLYIIEYGKFGIGRFTVQYVATNHGIADFKFTNQNGRTVHHEKTEGRFMLLLFNLQNPSVRK
jgi:cytochrome oxidase Cu insertion factor (SCO1/SenC/PrrC family)